MLANQEGKSIPKLNFKVQENNQWADWSSDDIFKGKNVIVFALPGAYTPTCTSAHLPRYEELYSIFQENGVDEVYCLSVNDTFVMNAWAKTLGVKKVKMLPDGNGDLSKALDMFVDKSAIGFGSRSWRYSMLVKDGTIEKMFIEEDKPGDPFEVSDANTMLNHINPNAKLPEIATIITKEGCPHCIRAKDVLRKNNIQYEELVIGRNLTARAMTALSRGGTTTPQIFINDEYIGTADDLEKKLNK